MVVARDILGLECEEREVYFSELRDFAECGLCGTAAVISPVGALKIGDEEICINNGEIGPVSKWLFDTLTGIQWGRLPDTNGWTLEV